MASHWRDYLDEEYEEGYVKVEKIPTKSKIVERGDDRSPVKKPKKRRPKDPTNEFVGY